MYKNRLITLPPKGVGIKGVIQFIHGMCEHKERYTDAMNYFAGCGYVCIISDLPGHGENLSGSKTHGYFGKNGMDRLLATVHRNTLYIKKHYPAAKYILFGHSMGSLVCRAYLKKYPDVPDCAIICGSPSDNNFKYVGNIIMRILIAIFGEKAKSDFARNLCTGSFERPFRKENLDNSWICSDKSVVEKYNKDKMCGFTFTLNGYRTLTELLIAVYSGAGWRISNPDMPICFISGESDPCMGNLHRFKKSVNKLKSAGYKNVRTKLFYGMRHEILNEKDRKKVYDYVDNYLTLSLS